MSRSDSVKHTTQSKLNGSDFVGIPRQNRPNSPKTVRNTNYVIAQYLVKIVQAIGRFENIVAATDLAVEMPTGTETGIQHDAFSRCRVYLTLTSSTRMSRLSPAGEHSSDGRCSPAQPEDNVMLTFYDVPLLRNISLTRDVSRVTNLPSRMTEKLVMRPSLFQLRMFLGASVEVCHDVA